MSEKAEHYRQVGFECIDMMKWLFIADKECYYGFMLGNAFKYIWRHKAKGGMQDLDKAEWYLKKFKEECGQDYDYLKDEYDFLQNALKKARGEE